jgi:TonB family protein
VHVSTAERAVGSGRAGVGRAGVAALAVLLLGGSPVVAQSDAGSTWLQWSTFEVFIAADMVRGVGLWVLPRGHEAVFVAREVRGDYYAPEDVLTWLRSADSVLHARRPAPDDARTAIATPLLPSLGSGGTVLLRKRDEKGWDRHPVLAFADSVGRMRLAIRAGDDDVTDTFLDALRKAAYAVRHLHRVESELVRDTRCEEVCGRMTPGAVPVTQASIPRPASPFGLARGAREGRVLLSYVVDTTGRADTSSIVVRFASEGPFAASAIAAIRAATFTPATIAGRPVRQCVQQRFRFYVGRR